MLGVEKSIILCEGIFKKTIISYNKASDLMRIYYSLNNILIRYFLVSDQNPTIPKRQRVPGDGCRLPKREHNATPTHAAARCLVCACAGIAVTVQNPFFSA